MRAVAVAVAAFAVAVVVAAGASNSTTRAAETRPIVVTRDDDSIRAACRPASIARKLNAFLRSYNRGERRVDRYVDFSTHGVDTSGGWFTIGKKKTQKARTAAAFRRLVRRQHARGERLALTDLNAGPKPPGGLADIQFQLERSATDETAAVTAMRGKGAIYCTSGRVFVFSAVPAGPGTVYGPIENLSDLCPKPPEGTPANATIACTRH